MKHEKEIFRECYNLLTKYLNGKMNKDDWEALKASASLLTSKYKEDIDDSMLCTELMCVVMAHLDRRQL